MRFCNLVRVKKAYLLLDEAFPERPGALRKFLEGLQQKWNISLFHYRNHGGGANIIYRFHVTVLMWKKDLGKVLAGIQVPEEDAEAFDKFLKILGCGYVEETRNPIYHRFLRG